ncbi:MAG TPA: prepilin-type N-terminal cleavage/methylation domain-containing protein [Candidatus Hydrogenedentes bacterium]|nr:prepilin-type N-terminal cleavage/methylation domain-containing protein [Candidatus Hydrogenedentota bacterium]
MGRQRGFTLIELMIVVAIIAIIAAIAIPNLMRSRIQANESSAIYNLRAIVSAQGGFFSSNSRFATEFNELTTSNPPYLNGNWGTMERSGYTFTMEGEDANFTSHANAVSYGVTGVRGFFVDSTGIIRGNQGSDADETSTPISDPVT